MIQPDNSANPEVVPTRKSLTRLTLKSKTAKPAPAAPTPAPTVSQFIWAPTEFRPKRRHSTLESAQQEAARLRALAPGKEFIVYKAELVQP